MLLVDPSAPLKVQLHNYIDNINLRKVQRENGANKTDCPFVRCSFTILSIIGVLLQSIATYYDSVIINVKRRQFYNFIFYYLHSSSFPTLQFSIINYRGKRNDYHN